MHVKIAFPYINVFRERLEIFDDCLTALVPRHDVINF